MRLGVEIVSIGYDLLQLKASGNERPFPRGTRQVFRARRNAPIKLFGRAVV